MGCSLGFFHSFNDAGVGIGGIDCPLDKAILVCALDNAVLEDKAIKSTETAQAVLSPMLPQTNPFVFLITNILQDKALEMTPQCSPAMA